MTSTKGIPSGGAVLAVDVEGAGSPIVFLHAGVADRRMWRAQLTALGETHLAIAYDRRGFGATQAVAEDHSSVADLVAVLDARTNGEPAILVGCSQGGLLALDMALTHPSRVGGLVLIAPSVRGAPQGEPPAEATALLAALDSAEAAGDLDAANALEARLWLDGPLQLEGRVAGPARDLFLDMNAIALGAPDLGRNLDDQPAYSRLGEIRQPGLILVGDLDFPHIQDRCRVMAAALPGAKGQAMSGVAHLPSLERPWEVTSVIRAFVAGLA
jgi:pimeloyl-ACP methyl ester carboxylesterase